MSHEDQPIKEAEFPNETVEQDGMGRIECGCGQVFMCPSPRRIITNGLYESLVFFPHDKPNECPRCHTLFVCGITEFQVVWGWVKAPPGMKPESRILVPSPGLKI